MQYEGTFRLMGMACVVCRANCDASLSGRAAQYYDIYCYCDVCLEIRYHDIILIKFLCV